MTSEKTKAATFLDNVHLQVCFENGDHHLEVDTAYSLGADALRRAEVADAMVARAERKAWEAGQDAAEHVIRQLEDAARKSGKAIRAEIYSFAADAIAALKKEPEA